MAFKKTEPKTETKPTQNNRGALFENDRKVRDGQPDYTGRITVEGVEYYLSGWADTSKAEQDYLSLTVTPVNK